MDNLGSHSSSPDMLDQIQSLSNGYLVTQKQPALLCGHNPEQSNMNHSEDEIRKNNKWREGAEEEREKDIKDKLEEEQEEVKKEGKMENEERHLKKKLVSKPLMDTLWAKFKLKKCPSIGDSLMLAFEFNMTEDQVNEWFFKKKEEFNKEMCKWKHKRKLKRLERLPQDTLQRIGALTSLEAVAIRQDVPAKPAERPAAEARLHMFTSGHQCNACFTDVGENSRNRSQVGIL
ncbi:NANOG neighbor homeobox [Phyllostomus hastatus]|uniref:NANOG neighbor homeobox n=1 Tax=Phyllostomus hastatus TaxID=9423 RepID=UPI001E685633|nr:NANOG neighbor homeobox [Phyllostomus hastatus]